jgi:hypothetical protein
MIDFATIETKLDGAGYNLSALDKVITPVIEELKAMPEPERMAAINRLLEICSKRELASRAFKAAIADRL